MSVPIPPSGEQREIVHGHQRATVVEVGGGIREYEAAGRPVLESYALDAVRDGAHGAPLVPWPNRLEDGRYSFDGSDQQVALSEPGTGNAIHGLLLWRPWRALEREDHRVVMGTTIFPEKGYPFTVEVSVAYELGDGGLEVATTATNVGDRACPFGSGQHPYLSPGDAAIDECTLELDASTRILTDERQLPAGEEDVSGTPFDFREARPLGDVRIDFPFTGLGRDREGLAWVRLGAPDGRTAELWLDEGYSYVELFTGDTLRPERRRRGLAAEPMTCPPNAFRTGTGVVRLEPGESVTTRWGARLA